MKKILNNIAELHSVTHDRTEDEVYVSFKVITPEYKDLVFRLARRDDVEWIVRGDHVSVSYEEE
jgi:hypothetical protein